MSIKTSPKDFFLQIAAFAALYVSVVSILTLLFQYIDILFPDELARSFDPFSGAIRFAIASLVIVFPIYILFTRLVNQDLQKNKEKQEGGLRKWLIYITLFVAGATIAGDLIALVNVFLGGEITVRFTLKVLAILLVVGAGFIYYFFDLRNKWSQDRKLAQSIGGAVSLLVLAVVVAGFFIIGTPGVQRDLRLDQQRVEDLNLIQFQIIEYWRSTDTLPATLEELGDPLIGFTLPTTPETNEPYGYSITGPLSFELCTTFTEPTPEYLGGTTSRVPYTILDSNWQHEAGEVCFERTIDPERLSFPKVVR